MSPNSGALLPFPIPRARSAALALALALATAPLASRAEPARSVRAAAAAEPVAPPQVLPDVVRLKDGGMLRGAIVEMDPSADVVIHLATGELRRVPMSRVSYAGPAAARAGEPAEEQRPAQDARRPLVEIHGDKARLRLQGNQPGVTFSLQTGENKGTGTAVGRGGAVTITTLEKNYSTICTAPCEASLPAGSYTLALSKDDGGPVEVEQPVAVSGPTTVTGEYVSRHGTRVAGAVVIIASSVVGGLLSADAFSKKERVCYGADVCSDRQNIDGAELVVGGSVMLGGLITGLILGSVQDEARVKVAPLTAPPQLRAPAPPGADRSARIAPPSGLQLSGRF